MATAKATLSFFSLNSKGSANPRNPFEVPVVRVQKKIEIGDTFRAWTESRMTPYGSQRDWSNY